MAAPGARRGGRLALAEWLDTDLVTADQRLVRAAGPLCPVRLVGDRPNG
jgi:hypothetical protein